MEVDEALRRLQRDAETAWEQERQRVADALVERGSVRGMVAAYVPALSRYELDEEEVLRWGMSGLELLARRLEACHRCTPRQIACKRDEHPEVRPGVAPKQMGRRLELVQCRRFSEYRFRERIANAGVPFDLTEERFLDTDPDVFVKLVDAVEDAEAPMALCPWPGFDHDRVGGAFVRESMLRGPHWRFVRYINVSAERARIRAAIDDRSEQQPLALLLNTKLAVIGGIDAAVPEYVMHEVDAVLAERRREHRGPTVLLVDYDHGHDAAAPWTEGTRARYLRLLATLRTHLMAVKVR